MVDNDLARPVPHRDRPELRLRPVLDRLAELRHKTRPPTAATGRTERTPRTTRRQGPAEQTYRHVWAPRTSGVLIRAGDADTEKACRVEHALVIADEGPEVGAELERAGEVDGVEGAEMGG